MDKGTQVVNHIAQVSTLLQFNSDAIITQYRQDMYHLFDMGIHALQGYQHLVQI